MTALLHPDHQAAWRGNGHLPAFAGAALMTAALFSLMTLLIGSQSPDLNRAPALVPITVDLPDRDLPDVTKIKPERPTEEMVPDQPERTGPVVTATSGEGPVVTLPDPAGPAGPPTGLNTDRPATRIFAIPPAYPPRAQEMGLEGFVIVGFDVARTGSVDRAWVEYSKASLFERAPCGRLKNGAISPKSLMALPSPSPASGSG